MKRYYYSFSYYLRKNRELFVVDEDGEITFVLKQNRFFFTEMAHLFSNLAKYTYRVESFSGKKELYSIIQKRGYYLRIKDSNKQVKIKQKQLQLIEKRQIFSIEEKDYSFEITATRTGVLKKNDEVVATARITNLLNEREDYEIAVDATESNAALLCMVCYQTFHLSSYEMKFLQ